MACRVFQNWLEHMIPSELTEDITFFDYALHEVPNKLRETVQATLDSIEEPSLIVLGYGLCGNGLHEIQAGKHTLLIPRTDDCIAIILGSYAAYRREFDKEPATYYLSKGWLEGGSTPLAEYKKYIDKYGQKKGEWLMDYQYRNYKRLALIVQNQADLEKYRPAAKEVARYCERWGFRYEELIGSDTLLRRLVEIAASPHPSSALLQTPSPSGRGAGGEGENDTDFIIIPPGGQLTQDLFLR